MTIFGMSNTFYTLQPRQTVLEGLDQFLVWSINLDHHVVYVFGGFSWLRQVL